MYDAISFCSNGTRNKKWRWHVSHINAQAAGASDISATWFCGAAIR